MFLSKKSFTGEFLFPKGRQAARSADHDPVSQGEYRLMYLKKMT